MKLVAALVLVLASPSAVALAPTSTEAGAVTTPLVVGAKNFPGAQILSQVYGQGLEARGRAITFKTDLGPTEVVFPALLTGDIDAYADYQGTLLAYLGGTPTADPDKTFTALRAKLVGTGIVASEPAPAVDKNGFYVTAKTAKKYRLAKVSDLTAVAPQLTLGAPPECAERPLCLGAASQALYHLAFKDVQKIDPGGPRRPRRSPAATSTSRCSSPGAARSPATRCSSATTAGCSRPTTPCCSCASAWRRPRRSGPSTPSPRRSRRRRTTACRASSASSSATPADIAAAFLARNELD